MDDWWNPALRRVFAGRRVIIAGAVPAAWNEHVTHLRAAGAADIMILATGGVGAGAGPDVATHIVEPPAGLSVMERIHFDNAALRSPSAEVRRVLDEFDPDGDAIVCGGFLTEAESVAGRPVLAWRRSEWVRFEDKTLVDDFWDRAGVRRCVALVVPLAEAKARAHEVDQGLGTMWAADSRDGYHGGGEATEWVVDEQDADRAESDLAGRCDRVRIMPFIDGIACSIHGIVDDGDVAVLRPVEMVTLRRGRELVYAGCATYWDPPEEIRTQMRSIARRAGECLRHDIGFRGTFTIDGVVNVEGFWPTELNPRFGAGINTIAQATGDIPILLIHDLIVAGLPIGLPLRDVEARLVEHADTHRSGGTWRLLAGNQTSPREVRRLDNVGVTNEDRTWRWARDDDRIDGLVTAGAGFARCIFDSASTPVGPSITERAADFWRFAEPELGLSATGAHNVLTAPDDPFADRL